MEISTNGEMVTDSVKRAYGQALFELAEASGRLEEMSDEVEQLAELIRAEPGLRRLLSSRALGVAERASSLERLFKGRVSDELYRFIQVVNRKDRLGKLPGMLEAFEDLVAERRGLVEVDVTVPRRLDDAEAQRITDALSKALGKQVVLHQYVDETLIGGLKLRVGDRLIDGSVATQLRRMRHRLVDAGRAKARELTALQEE